MMIFLATKLRKKENAICGESILIRKVQNIINFYFLFTRLGTAQSVNSHFVVLSKVNQNILILRFSRVGA
jgi:hypothetical protein